MPYVTEPFSGTEVVGSLEHSLTTDTAGPDTETSDGEFQLFLDVSDLAAGEELRIRGYEKVRSSDSQRIVHEATLIGAQSPPIYVTPKLMLMHGWDFTLQMVGVGSPTPSATITWSIRKLSTDDIETDTQDIQSRLPAALVSGRIDASVGAMAANVMTAAAAAADLTTELQSGLATAAALAAVDTVVDAIQAKTDNLPSDPADQSLIIAATNAIVADTEDIQSRLPAALVSGRIDASVGAMAANVMTAAAAAADLTTELQSGLATAAALTTVEGKIDTIDGIVDAIVADTGTDGVVVAAASKTGYALSTAGVDAILDEVIEDGKTMRELLRGYAAALLGKASGLDTTNAKYRDLADGKDRINATVDADGNRTAVALDLS